MSWFFLNPQSCEAYHNYRKLYDWEWVGGERREKNKLREGEKVFEWNK